MCAQKSAPTGAIRYDDTDRITTDTFGAIILATGYDLIDWTKLYGDMAAKLPRRNHWASI